MKRLDVYLLMTPDTEAYVQNMGRETHEMLAFLRGLPQREYDIGVHGLHTVSETVKRHRLSSDHFPLLVLDGNILSSGRELKPDDLSDLLRLGCENVSDESSCCRDVDDLRDQSAEMQAAMPDLARELAAETRLASPSGKPVVLFVCRHNSCRSQMAEAFLRQLAGDRFEVLSCGLASRSVHPLAVKAMSEAGIDISRQTSRACADYIGHVSVAWAIFVCSVSEDECPAVYPFAVRYLRWPFDDPTVETGTEDERMRVFRRVRDEIRGKIERWLEKEQ